MGSSALSCETGDDCPLGQVCGEAGYCAEDPGPGASDAGARPTPTPGPGRDAGTPSDASSDPQVCADVTLQTERQIPSVYVIVDQSGSMNADFGNTDRWNGIRDVLIGGPGTLIYDLNDQVDFGLVLYSARSDGPGGNGGNPIGACPDLTTVSAAPNNYSAINGTYAGANYKEDTPTGDSIDALLNQLLAQGLSDRGPTVFVLATDGLPDRCEDLDPSNNTGRRIAEQEAVGAVQRAYDNGIKTYVIAVNEDLADNSHFREMARTGSGGSSEEYYVPNNDAALRYALSDIVQGQLTCEIELNGAIENLERACEGTVSLNGQALPCDAPNGWRVLDENTFELTGSACDQLLNSTEAEVEASFPCDVAVLI